MTTATYNFAPKQTVWIINKDTTLNVDTVQEAVVSQVTIVANTFNVTTTYKTQLVPSFTFVDVVEAQVQLPIVAATAGLNGTFSVTGDVHAIFVTGFNFNVDNSPGNNGPYVVASPSVFGGVNTVITVTGTVPNGVAGGVVSYVQNPKIFPDVDSALAALKKILTA